MKDLELVDVHSCFPLPIEIIDLIIRNNEFYGESNYLYSPVYFQIIWLGGEDK